MIIMLHGIMKWVKILLLALASGLNEWTKKGTLNFSDEVERNEKRKQMPFVVKILAGETPLTKRKENLQCNTLIY